MTKIPFSPPHVTEAEIAAVVEALRSGWITTGPRTKQFEREIATLCGTRRAVCLNSATAAMEMALRVLGIGEGDEVITSAYTYSASASVIAHVGAKVVLADVKSGSLHMDIEDVRSKLTERTKAVIPVDIAGVPFDAEALASMLEEEKAKFRPTTALQKLIGRAAVVCDAAHSFGAERDGKPTGSLADFTCFSFHAVKNLTTAEGGAVTWVLPEGADDEAVYRELMLLSLHGQTKDALAKASAGSWEYDIVGPYYKCNMTDIMAALGLAQLKRYEELLARRRSIIDLYEKELADLPVSWWKHEGENFRSSGHLFLLRIDGADETVRNRVLEAMDAEGIACNVHYKPLPMLTAYKNMGFRIEDFPESFAMYENELTLPLHTLLTDDDVRTVASTLGRVLKDHGVR